MTELSLSLADERLRQVAHARRRLLERYGLFCSERDLEVLAALARRYGVAVPGAAAKFRSRWLDVPFRGVTVRCCLDEVTEMVSTVIPRGDEPPVPRNRSRGTGRPTAMWQEAR